MISLHALTLFAVLSSPGDPVLLDFHADWCGPCRSMDPTIRKLVADGYPVRKVNIDREQQVARQYGVDRVPTYVLVAGGREVTRVVGPTSYAGLTRLFDAARSPGEQPGGQVAGVVPCSVATTPAPGSLSSGAIPDAKSRSMHATVRLRVEDQRGNSVGTGTIVDVHGQEALVMTCAHIFRDSQGAGNIQVDLFAPGATAPVPGKVIDYDLEQDVALVAIRPGIPLPAAPVAAKGYAVRPGDPVFSIGCDRGADPSIRESRVTNLNKYVGPANIEVAGAPVIGRSGGGLFSADGHLIGICNLADPKDDEGIYAATSLLHAQLDENNLAWIYNGQTQSVAQADPPQAPLAATGAAPSAPVGTQPPAMARQMPRTPLADSGQTQTLPLTTPAQAPSQPSAPLFNHLAEGAEVICIVRSRQNPEGKAQVFVLEQPSQALLNQLAAESQPVETGGPQVLEASLVGAGGVPPRDDTTGPVMRGQTQ
jgi:thiol-disulfide isomerase/thioredoxin